MVGEHVSLVFGMGFGFGERGRGGEGVRTRCLDFTAVHCQHDAGTPVEETLCDTLTDELDGIAGQAAHVQLIAGAGFHGEVF